MNLQTKKLRFIEEILAIKDERILDKLKDLLKSEKEGLDAVLITKLKSRANFSNLDLEMEHLYTREELELKLLKSLGI